EYNGSLDETIAAGSGVAQLFYQRGDFTAILGLRRDSYSSFGPETSPRAALSYQHKNWLIRVAAGKAFRAPAISDLYLPPTSYMGMTFRGNPNLKPEYAYTYEIGLRKFKTIKERENRRHNLTAKTDFTLYTTDAKDFFDYILVDPATLTFEPRNVTRTSIWGVEFQSVLSNIITPRLNLLINFSYTDARYKEYPQDPFVEGKNVEYIPRHSGSAALSYNFPNGTRFLLYCRASDHRNTDPQNYKVNNLHSYSVFGLRFESPLISPEKEKRWGGSSFLFLSVDNLLDEKYFEVKGSPAPGRTFSAGVKVEF
ncbi:MAG: TonB-dependent receptor, partial [Planctomycetota bacterium]|nr:TonB-dependent receptor [Planctomycetota bacterium]